MDNYAWVEKLKKIGLLDVEYDAALDEEGKLAAESLINTASSRFFHRKRLISNGRI